MRFFQVNGTCRRLFELSRLSVKKVNDDQQRALRMGEQEFEYLLSIVIGVLATWTIGYRLQCHRVTFVRLIVRL